MADVARVTQIHWTEMLANEQIFECMEDFEPEKGKPEQLALNKGDKVHVLDHGENGWFSGYKENTVATGWFPGGFVRPIAGAFGSHETVHTVSSPVRGDRGRAQAQEEQLAKAHKKIHGLEQELARAEERANCNEAAMNDAVEKLKELKIKEEDAKTAQEQVHWLQERASKAEDRASKAEENLGLARKKLEDQQHELVANNRNVEAQLRRYREAESKASEQNEQLEAQVRQLKEQLRQLEEAAAAAQDGPRRLVFQNEGRSPVPPLPRPEVQHAAQPWAPPLSARQSLQSSPTKQQHQQPQQQMSWQSPRGSNNLSIATQPQVKHLVQDFERRVVSREPSLQRHHFALPTSGSVAPVSRMIQIGSSLRASSQEVHAQIARPGPTPRTLQTSASASEEQHRFHPVSNLGMSPIKRHGQTGVTQIPGSATRSPLQPQRTSLVKELRSKFEAR